MDLGLSGRLYVVTGRFGDGDGTLVGVRARLIGARAASSAADLEWLIPGPSWCCEDPG